MNTVRFALRHDVLAVAAMAGLLLCSPPAQAWPLLYERSDFATGASPQTMTLVTLNGDAVADLIVVNSLDDTVSVLLGNPDGTFAPAVHYPVGDTPRAAAAADFDDDGAVDIAVTNADDGEVLILLGDGQGGFQPGATYAVAGWPSSVATDDLDGDDRPDLVLALGWPANAVAVLLADAGGAFQAPAYLDVLEGPATVLVQDLSDDKIPDIAATNFGNGLDPYYVGSVSVMIGRGDGTFEDAVHYTAGYTTLGIAALDLEGDGDPDLVATNLFGNELSLYRNEGNGVFVPAAPYPLSCLGPVDEAAGDLDGDMDADLAVSCYDSQALYLLLNQGDGTFWIGGITPTESCPADVEVADLNDDGRRDLLVANNCGASVSTFRAAPSWGLPLSSMRAGRPAVRHIPVALLLLLPLVTVPLWKAARRRRRPEDAVPLPLAAEGLAPSAGYGGGTSPRAASSRSGATPSTSRGRPSPVQAAIRLRCSCR